MLGTWLENIKRLTLFGVGSAGTYAAATFAGVVNVPEIADPRALACIVRDEAKLRFGEPPPPPAAGTRVLVARLDLDKDGKQTRHVVDSLSGTPGFEIQPLCRTLALGEDRDTSVAMRDAVATGRTWLQQRNATILVWGQVEQDDKSVRLRLLSQDSEGADRFLSLADDLRLPKDFAPQLSVMLAASVLSQSLALMQDDSRASSKTTEQLLTLLPQLRALATSASTLPNGQGKDSRDAYLSALIRLTRQTGDTNAAKTGLLAYAEEAVAYADAELSRIAPDEIDARASVLFWRARATGIIATRNVDVAKLEESIETYNAVDALWTRKRSPREWARTQTYLGSAFRRLGDWKDDDALLNDALASYNNAIAASPRVMQPIDWARAQSGLGITYRMMGERRDDLKLLEASVQAFENALLERTRSQLPRDWASTQSNLASSLAALAERKQDPVLIERSIAAYQSALEVHTRSAFPQNWATTQDRLGTALLMQGRLTSDATKVEAAISAFRASLQERTQQRSLSGFAATNAHLGAALAELAERRQDAALYDQAADALNASIIVYDSKGLERPAEKVRKELSVVEAKRLALRGS